MKFNPSKSEVVLGMRGKGSKEFLHQHLPGSADKCCLVIGIGAIGRATALPIVYLGVVAYGNFDRRL